MHLQYHTPYAYNMYREYDIANASNICEWPSTLMTALLVVVQGSNATKSGTSFVIISAA